MSNPYTPSTPDQPGTPHVPGGQATPAGPPHPQSGPTFPQGAPAPVGTPTPQAGPPSSGGKGPRNIPALVALVLAVLGTILALVHGVMILGWVLLPAAFILSIVGLVQHGRPKGMAIAALVLSILGTVAGVIAFASAVGNAVDDAFDQSGTPAPQVTQAPESGAESTPKEDSTAGSSTAPKEVTPQPFNASGLLGGNASPNLPDGEPGKVSVVQVGSLLKDKSILLFAFRNNTDEAIGRADWSATARSAGSIIGSGSSQGITPVQIQPGEVGLAYIYFDTAETFPDDVEYEFQVKTSGVSTSLLAGAPLKVSEANLNGDAIVGGASNETGHDAQGPFMADVYCFDGDNLVDQAMGAVDQDSAAPGDNVSFSVSLYDQQCTTFAVGVSGFFN